MFKIHNERTKTKRKLRVSLKIYRPKILQIQHLQKKENFNLSIIVSKDSRGETSPPIFRKSFFPRFRAIFPPDFCWWRISQSVLYTVEKYARWQKRQRGAGPLDKMCQP